MTKSVTPATALAPVAWLYDGPEGERHIREHRDIGHAALVRVGWTETPLHAHPPADNPGEGRDVRGWVAKLYCAAGCSCCRNDEAWREASERLGELLGAPRYDDDSGVDWYAARDAAQDSRP